MSTLERIARAVDAEAKAHATLHQLIRQAHTEGVPITEIAHAARVSRPAIYRILREGNAQ